MQTFHGYRAWERKWGEYIILENASIKCTTYAEIDQQPGTGSELLYPYPVSQSLIIRSGINCIRNRFSHRKLVINEHNEIENEWHSQGLILSLINHGYLHIDTSKLRIFLYFYNWRTWIYFITYKLNLFKKKLDINKYDKHLISNYIFIFFLLQNKLIYIYIYIYIYNLNGNLNKNLSPLPNVSNYIITSNFKLTLKRII